MLPKFVDPIRLCKQGELLKGELRLSALPRLQAICDQQDRVVQVTLTFGIDKNGVLVVQGLITGEIRLICQRCNQPMNEVLAVESLLSPVLSDDRAKKLPKAYEALFLVDDAVVIADMIEEEILLALPMVSKHEDCSI